MDTITIIFHNLVTPIWNLKIEGYRILNRWKEYYVKVDVRSADINNSRFTHGLYVQYGCGFLAEKKDFFQKKISKKFPQKSHDISDIKSESMKFLKYKKGCI